ncbi:DNA-binding domain-containing protein [Paracoccus sp. MBLB3053]|uniref:DNA-binding domain-containing protein n=1 Tax=Paracoccus aurantius TaxID=3073814 RepID=A0ABU2HV99_9RHOB|nr:DNA-binding domain-containing protein [Paracoccus sp. MBLB3053]MDS9468968.1 DNA-binding domain-containing protein [Paracoccus sp. MBLB3053]
MLAHAEFTRQFHRKLLSGEEPPPNLAASAEEAKARFAVYRNNVVHGLSSALARRFPVVERLVGSEFFRAMAVHYLRSDPPGSPILQDWGEGFPEFAADFPPLSGLPYLPDVARLEWLSGRAYHAADMPRLTPDALAGASTNPASFAPGLHPSVAVLASRHAVFSIWQANQPGETAQGLVSDRPESVLILRDYRDRVRLLQITPGDAAFVKTLRDGKSLLQAALAAADREAGHQPSGILGLLASYAAFVLPESEGGPR